MKKMLFLDLLFLQCNLFVLKFVFNEVCFSKEKISLFLKCFFLLTYLNIHFCQKALGNFFPNFCFRLTLIP
jgi:hypothetical protein